MPRSNDDVARVLTEFADLLAIVADDPFKPRAYEKAARAIEGFPDELRDLDDAGIRAIPNVGKSIAEKVRSVLETGTFPELEELRAQVPPGVRAMTAIPGFGPKKAMVVYRELGIDGLDQLVAAARDGRLRGLKGFSAKTEENVLEAVRRARRDTGRVTIDVAMGVAGSFLERLRTIPGVQRADHAGSLRRMAETIGDVDLLVASERSGPIMDAFTEHQDVGQILARGDTKSSVVTRSGLQVDLRVIRKDAWGAAMIYFTGSKPHNVRIREMAVRKGLKLNEYGLFEVETDALIAAETETEVYERLGLPYIEPTLREDRGEIEAALAGELPQVVTLKQMRGDLHTHTDLTDGVATLEQMLEAAAAKRYAYYAVTDHAPNLAMQRMTDEKMVAQRAKLRRLQDRFPKMTLLHGTELNIDPDGAVDWPAAFLEGFDITVASIHSHFNQSRDAMTRRMIRAMENPNVNVMAIPPHARSDVGIRWTSTWTRCSKRLPGPEPRSRSTPTPTGSTCATSTSGERGAPAFDSRSTPTPTRLVTWTRCATASASRSADG